MRKTFIIASFLLIAASLSAKQYPDSIQQQGKQEPNIAYGWNFEFGGGIGVSSFAFKQLGSAYTSPHTMNAIQFPAGNAGIGINYYFVPWMGIGTGAEFAAYANTSKVISPWTVTTYDKYGTSPMNLYTMTSTPSGLQETQSLYMVEIPLALKFRARPNKLGFIGSLGVKLGVPVFNHYNLPAGGSFNNEVYYEFFDLHMADVPNVIEDITVPGYEGSLLPRFKKLNYAAFLELGMLIQLSQRVDLAISAYGSYYFNDLLDVHGYSEVGFLDGTKAGEYPMPYTAPYKGMLASTEVESLHPWSAGIKIGIQVNANRTKAQREFDREQRRLRKAMRDSLANLVEEEPEGIVIVPVVPDTIPEEVIEEVVEEPVDSVALFIEEVRMKAAEKGIDLCKAFCEVIVHDTIYIHTEPQPEPVAPKNVAQMLDDELKGAIIYFDLDKAIPILEPEDILIRVAEMLRNHPNQKIHVNGHACKLGKPDYNKRLALRRANAVADQLRALGVKDEQMIIASLGSDVPFRYNGEHQLSKDRRVEIIPSFEHTQTAQPVQPAVNPAPEQTVKETPAKEVAPAKTTPAKPAATKPAAKQETVKPGSRLVQIARRHYNEAEYWIFIYEANRDKIADPSNLPTGIVLDIPDLTERLKGMTKEEALAEAKRLKSELLKK